MISLFHFIHSSFAILPRLRRAPSCHFSLLTSRLSPLVLLLLLPLTAHAAKFSASVARQDLQLRKNAPIPLEIQVEHQGGEIITGHFEATVLHRDRRAGIHRSAEIVIASGRRTVPLLLPPPTDVRDGDGVAVRLRWIGQGGPRDFGEQRLGVYGFSSNELVLAIARTDRRFSDGDRYRERSLALENLRPTLDTPGWRSFNTLSVSVPVEKLPVHPLALCAYDAVFLDTATLALMSEKQLSALARWIESGGSAMIATGDVVPIPLTDRQVAFLNRLAPENVVFRLEEGRVVCAGAGPASVRMQPLLGRVSVQLEPPLADTEKKAYEGKEWLASVGWFWKMHDREVRHVEREGTWSKGAMSIVPREMGGWGDENEWRFANWLSSTAIGYDEISPDKPRPLPVGLVALLLGTLLVAVGPGDWFLLGWLRRRRWTWLLLPILCVASAWWATHLASRTIGRLDRTGTVVITDVAPDGRVLRECRIEMLLPARDREWALTVRDGVATPFPRMTAPAARQDQPAEDTDATGEWKSAHTFEWRRNVRQWTPVMSQRTSFPDGKDASGIDWEGVLARWAVQSKKMEMNVLLDTDGWHVLMAQPSAREVVRNHFGEVDTFQDVLTFGRHDADSRLGPHFVSMLLTGNPDAATAGVLARRSPSISGLSALRAGVATPLAALAWKEGPHELHIVRKHFTRQP